jgi:hypothetical protein
MFLTLLKTLAVMAGMILIIPLCVWAGSGSLRTAWHATKQYCLIMALIFGAGFVVAAIILLGSLGAS